MIIVLGWRGAIQILSTAPTVDWVLLGPGESNNGQEFGNLVFFGTKSV